jgi:hypothetical protein
VLRYLGRPLKANGQPDGRLLDDVMSRLLDFNDGARLRHWSDQNSCKLYNELNNLRFEATVNNPGKFLVHRHKQGQDASEPKTRRPLRKGVADIPLRAQLSQEINERFMADVANFKDQTPVRELLDGITVPRLKNGRRVRALDLIGKDRELLQLISDPAFRISGLTNKAIRQHLFRTRRTMRRTDKQLSGWVSRQLRLLRDHGIIRKLPKQNRYQLTSKGSKIVTVLNAFLATSTEELIAMAA